MRKRLPMICLICLALLAPAAIHAHRQLPLDTRPLIEAKYGGWAGVLRLWVCEGWTPGAGSSAAWLNRCVTTFERAHEGVYVQPEFVEPEALATISESGILPPDLVLFPPGGLVSPEWLAPLEADARPREPIADRGCFDGDCLAVPVAMGAYLWAYNTGSLAGIPDTWADSPVDPVAPPAEPFRQWGAALLALCSARYVADVERADSTSPSNPSLEMDLGLSPASATESPAPTPVPDAELLDCALPDGFAFNEEAYRQFINGAAAAIPVTQREVRRLEALADQGRGVDWALAQTGEGAFTDQLLFLGVVRTDDAGAKRALCHAFAKHLLDDACQGELHRSGLFAVTDADSGYAPGDPLRQMDAVLRVTTLAAPNAFDADWPRDVDRIVREFIEGRGTASALWRRLARRLR